MMFDEKDICTTCALQKVVVKNELVRGATVCICGESPGKEEEIQGRPFVGPSGQLLWRVVKDVLGLSREEVSVVNATRCQITEETKKVKSVLAKVIKPCRQFLCRDLQHARPKVIIALGEVALSQLLNKWASIARNRGKLIWSEEFQAYIFPTYHPAMILRRGGASDKNPFWQMWLKDFAVVKKLIESDFKTEALQYKEYDGNRALIKDVIALDAEWDEKGNLLVFSVSDGKETRYITPETLKNPEVRKALNNLFYRKKFLVVANRPVDERVLLRHGIVSIKSIRKIDVLNMANLVNENIKINLENVAQLYTKKHNIKEQAKAVGKQVWKMEKQKLIEYNCQDTEATIEAFWTLYKKISSDLQLFNYWKRFVLPVEEMLADICLHGFKIDKEKLQINKAQVFEAWSLLQHELLAEIPEAILLKHKDKGLSLTRAELVLDFLFLDKRGLQLEVKEFTPTGKPSISEGHLKKIDHPWVKRFLEWKWLTKLLTTYFNGLEKNMDEHGYIYPSIVLHQTQTGRTTCYNPNIQQVPRSGLYIEKLKELYSAPDGWLMGARDLSQSELRIVAWHANERNMLDALRKGIDLHSLTASLILGIPIEKVEKTHRQLAKAVNFGLIYGQSARGLMEYAIENYGVQMTEEEAEEFREKFFKSYPALVVYHRRCIEIARRFKQIRSVLGRIRRLPHIDSKDYAEVSKAERQAINFPIQSFSSDLGLIGMYLFWKEVRDKRDVRLLWFIHDAIFFMCEEDKMEKYMALLKECMEERSVEYILKAFKVKVGYPVESEGKAGKNWADLQEWKE